ncbi:hypothetical protein LX15_005915 [Streptoalloteichus tenebrarius]|uniref:Erythromycin biosynthesis protein CIII-like C-terminal domain-containing protein n=1 Tax=Streptoalloteichus tenebrarius (strain ATCC 17920 / DSM 40477 / JCM 4838 / CBS 697.72 / NBRC 16177 / NCIMB 11028 / NRRL B-12390 / A12253. 1 / ISP 5477) TaxID=1933 RepID=A0ABT1I391_STRSD|nr:macrolide family glycosyltransferase [Streptoalloteichus tenebrarius]MCP2262181.1 hypothetical protein [Streptoalloteichus tenebrarius]BFE98980.1 glycosyltransferase [Streptoalloteichus tenebrarius]
MSRIVVAGMPASGHVNPSVPVVRALVERGVEVTYYTDEEFRPAVEHTGAEFRAYPTGTITSRDIAEATSNGGPVLVVRRLLAAAETLVPFLVDELRARRPDAVAFDSNAVWGYVAAATLDLPKISLMTTCLLGTSAFKRLKGREKLHSMWPMLPHIPGAVAGRQRIVRRFGKRVYPPSPTLPMRGDLTIFPIPRELQEPDPRIDDRCHFVGPTIDRDTRADRLDPELAAHLDGSAPVVLVSLGTLHAGTDAFFRDCFTALGDLPARVVLAVGKHTDPASLGRPPANTLVRTSVPQLDVLARAAVFVTHGGMNSALEGLAHGVPLVVLPQQVEQLAIGGAVTEAGAGVVLRHHLANRPVPPAELRAAVDRALTDPSLRTGARTLGERLTAGGGATAAADLITSFLATKH